LRLEYRQKSYGWGRISYRTIARHAIAAVERHIWYIDATDLPHSVGF
jgi:hypothetical protein